MYIYIHKILTGFYGHVISIQIVLRVVSFTDNACVITYVWSPPTLSQPYKFQQPQHIRKHSTATPFNTCILNVSVPSLWGMKCSPWILLPEVFHVCPVSTVHSMHNTLTTSMCMVWPVTWEGTLILQTANACVCSNYLPTCKLHLFSPTTPI